MVQLEGKSVVLEASRFRITLNGEALRRLLGLGEGPLLVEVNTLGLGLPLGRSLLSFRLEGEELVLRAERDGEEFRIPLEEGDAEALRRAAALLLLGE